MDKNIIEKFDFDGEKPEPKKNTAKKPVKPFVIYGSQLLSLVALLVIAFFNNGYRALIMALFSLAGAVLTDVAGCSLSRKVYNPGDLSTLTAGLCIALLMPASANYLLAFFGSAAAISVKHIFGGKNNYIFNPTATAFAFLIICYPAKMLLFPAPYEWLPVRGEPDVSLLAAYDSAQTLGVFDILRGNFRGALGTVHILVLLICGICLIFSRSISPVVTISAFSAVAVFSGLFTSGGNFMSELLKVFVSGYFLFILIFLANDPQTLPKTHLGRLYYGLMFGLTTVFFKSYGKVEGSPAFALLLVNTLSERSDTAADKTISAVKRATVFIRNRLGSYERIREQAENAGETIRSSDIYNTQEIAIPTSYNMPPIDNKVIKIKRKKPVLLVRIQEKIGTLSEKIKSRKKEETPKHDIRFLENLREGFKDLGRKKKQELSVPEYAESDVTITPLTLSLLVDDDDVVEIGVPDDEPEIEDAEAEEAADTKATAEEAAENKEAAGKEEKEGTGQPAAAADNTPAADGNLVLPETKAQPEKPKENTVPVNAPEVADVKPPKKFGTPKKTKQNKKGTNDGK